MRIGITGIHGLIGSKIAPLLAKKHTLIPLSKREGFDLLNEKSVLQGIEQNDLHYVLHLAAYTNVDEAEKQKALLLESEAWKINVLGARYVAQATSRKNIKLIHVSTDMVFGKDEKDFFDEKSTPAPVNFYGLTKYEGEKEAQKNNSSSAIVRIAYPYTFSAEKKDYVRVFLGYLKENKSFSSVADCFYTPTYIEDIAISIDAIIENDITGIIHSTSGEKLSGFEIAQIIAEKFKFDKNLVSKTTRKEFFKDRAPRAYNTALENTVLNKYGVKLHTLNETLSFMPKELLKNE